MTQSSDGTTPVQQPGGTNWTLHCTLHTSLPVPTAASSLRASTDHRPEDCALATVQHPIKLPSSDPPPSREWLRPQGRQLARGTPYNRPGPSRMAICSSWNRGKCIFPGTCNFRHICVLCLGNHQARACTRGGQGSSSSAQRLPANSSSAAHR